MTRLLRALACLVLTLSAACDRDLYVGRDAPLVLRESSDAGAADALDPSTPGDDGVRTQVAPAPEQMPASQAAPEPAPPVCEAQRADCDGDASNGCETDLTQDRDHCGGCGTRCQTPDCSCDNGKLTLHCDSAHADCDAMLSNGCETEIMTSMQHCGACQHACHTNGHDVTSAVCVSGRCEIACEPRISPEADCDGNADNGCETYLLFDAQHCGQCGNACAACEAGVCMN